MNRSRVIVLMALVSVCLAACATAPTTDEERTALQVEATAAVQRFRQIDPGLGPLMDRSAGYAIFPSIAKGGLGIGGAYGRGQLFVGGKFTGYCDVSQATLGVQAGGQEYSELILFENDWALTRFKSGELALAAQASAIAARAGASTDADFKDGVIVFTRPVGGLMFEASVGGQRFSFESR